MGWITPLRWCPYYRVEQDGGLTCDAHVACSIRRYSYFEHRVNSNYALLNAYKHNMLYSCFPPPIFLVSELRPARRRPPSGWGLISARV